MKIQKVNILTFTHNTNKIIEKCHFITIGQNKMPCIGGGTRANIGRKTMHTERRYGGLKLNVSHSAKIPRRNEGLNQMRMNL